MANTVNKKIIVDGPRNVVLSVYLKSDGASGDLNGEVLLAPADVGLNSDARFRISYLMYNFAGFAGVLEFDTGLITPDFKWVLPEGVGHPLDFGCFSNLIDTSGLDGTGELLLSTNGFTQTTDQGSILLLIIKP